MLDDIQTWRARIGLYCARIQCSRGGPKKNTVRTHRSRPSTKKKQPGSTGGLGGSESVLLVLGMLQVAVVLFSLLTVSGDVELNPGPGKGEAGGELAHSAGDKGALTIANLRDVINKLWGVRTQWMEIGLSLGLQLSDLQSIEMSARDDPGSCLTNMLESWLMREDRVHTWKDVVTALHSVGKVRVASEIEKTQLAESSDMKPDQTDLDEESSEVQEDGRHPVSSERELVHLPIDNWFDVGLKLQLSEKDLKKIKSKHSSNEERMRIEMLSMWFHSQPMATYETLVEALAATENKQTAEEVCKKQGIALELVVQSARERIPTNVRQYAEHLKETYLSEPVIQEDPWPPVVSEQYINLALITHKDNEKKIVDENNRDKIIARKKKLDLQGVFELSEDKKSLKVLIDGAPGTGKSTLCRKVVQDWSRSELLQDFTLVILVPLRDPEIAHTQTIDDFFYHDDDDVQAAVVKYVKQQQGASVLFIFDGFDELTLAERTKNSLFLQLLRGKKLPKCSVVVTSRPYASNKLHSLHTLTRHVEVLGFDEEQIENCIVSAIDNKEHANNLLKSRHELHSLCQIPLNCAIIIYVYRQEGFVLPHSVSEVYDCFISNILEREADLQEVECASIFEADLLKLCKLAFMGMESDMIIFHGADIRDTIGTRFTPANLLGLLTGTKGYISRGRILTYQFTHLTLQEYLAAKWVHEKFSCQEQAVFIQNHFCDGRYEMMLTFLAGLNKLDNEAFEAMFADQDLDLCSWEETADHRAFSLSIRLLYESQNSSFCRVLCKNIRDNVLIVTVGSGHTMSFPLAFFLYRSDWTWEVLNIKLINGQFLPHFLQEYQASSSSTKVRRLFLDYVMYYFEYTFFDMSNVASLLDQSTFSRLESLSICTNIDEEQPHAEKLNSVDKVMFDPIVKLIKSKSLNHLTMRGVPGVGEIDFHEFVTDIECNLVSLDIQSRKASLLLFCSLEYEQHTCRNLRTLCLQVYPVTSYPLSTCWESMAAITLMKNKSLETIIIKFDEGSHLSFDFSYPMVFYENTLMALSLNTSVTRLTLADCRVDPYRLMEMLEGNSTLKILNLVRIPFTNNLFKALGLGLKENETLSKLCVIDHYTRQYNDIVSFTELFRSLEDNDLPISDRGFSPICWLFCTMCRTTSKLNTLILDCHPGKLSILITNSFVLRRLARMLIQSPSIDTFTLNYTELTEVHLAMIARALVLNGRRKDFSLTLGSSLKPALDFSYISPREYEILFPYYCSNKQTQYQEEFVQTEVNHFKQLMFESMITTLTHVLSIRRKREQSFFNKFTLVKFCTIFSTMLDRRVSKQETFLKVIL